MYYPNENDLLLLKQPKQEVIIKIELLNYKFQTVDFIEGTLISDSFTIDSESDIRRTMNLTMHIDDISLTLGYDKKIWYDKYLRISVGYHLLRYDSWVYYPAGIYLFSDVGYHYNADSKELSLSCVDMMSKFTGARNGILSGLSTEATYGYDLRTMLVAVVSGLGGIQKYKIVTDEKDIPYTLEFQAGSSVYDVLTKICDLYTGYEFFFDEDTFVYQPIPTCLDEPVAVTSDVISPLVISEDTNYSLSDMKNVTELWGKCLETDYYTEDVSLSGDTYTISIPSLVRLEQYDRIAFKTIGGASPDSPKIIIKGYNGVTSEALPLETDSGKALSYGAMDSDTVYVVRYRYGGNRENYRFVFLGQYQIAAICKLVSKEPTETWKLLDMADEPTKNVDYMVCPDNPFAVDIEGNEEVRQTLADGDYDSIDSEEEAVVRARYETYKATNLTDTISLEMICVPWLDVNTKIEYTSCTTGQTNQYITLSISGSYSSGTMSLSMRRFYDEFYWKTS